MAQVARQTEPTTGALRNDGYLPIEAYAAVGDGRSLALVGVDGAIDWMCQPELDSASVFGAVLDPERGGHFTLAPAVPFETTRRYHERTNVLETTFETAEGRVSVIDAMTIDKSQSAPWSELVRVVHAYDGTVPMRWEFRPRFEFGQRSAELESHDDALLCRHGTLQLCLRTWDAGTPHISAGAESAAGEFTFQERQEAVLALLSTQEAPTRIPERDEVLRRLRETAEVWRAWVARHTYEGPYQQAVERSLLAIRLLADGRTGAITAAGTTSLPEVIGGARNYDYRFGWVRDLCFTLDALLAVGMEELAQSSVSWLLDATSHTHPRIDPVYSLGGEVVRGQKTVSLPGYRRTRPVHVGNSAGSQLQLGGFGDFIETIATYVEHGHVLPRPTAERLADVVDLLSHLWQAKDAGLWELGDTAHYGTSKLGCWVAFERLLDLVDKGQAPPRHVARWKGERDRIACFVEEHLFSPQKHSYLFKPGSEGLDCGMLLGARRGFMKGDRLAGTIDAIRRELGAGGALLYRYTGMQDEENAFLPCSFWMAEALAVAGRHGEAHEVMEDALGAASDVGLYSEEMEPGSRAMRGNFPQALTHLALISAASMLAKAMQ